jgi:hypothetical protein
MQASAMRKRMQLGLEALVAFVIFGACITP